MFSGKKGKFGSLILPFKVCYWSEIAVECLFVLSISIAILQNKKMSSVKIVNNHPGREPILLCYVKELFAWSTFNRMFSEYDKLRSTKVLSNILGKHYVKQRRGFPEKVCISCW